MAISSVQTFFNNYADALITYSPEKISAYYQAPMAVYSDQGILFVNEESEIVDFWKKGVKPYESMNIDKAVATVLSEEKLSESITATKVKWESYDKAGKKVASETNFYILTEKHRRTQISGLIIMAK